MITTVISQSIGLIGSHYLWMGQYGQCRGPIGRRYHNRCVPSRSVPFWAYISPSSSKCVFCLSKIVRHITSRSDQVQSISVATEAASNRPQVRLKLLESGRDRSSPQHLHRITDTGNAGNASALNLKSGPRQQRVLKVDDDVLLILVLSPGGFRLDYLKVLVDVGTLLANALDERILEEGFGLLADVGYLAGILINEQSGGIPLGVLPGLDGSVLAVDVLGGEGNDPVQGMGKVDEEREAISALAPDLKEGGEAVR